MRDGPFYYHLFMTTFLPCIYNWSIRREREAAVVPYPIRPPFAKIK